MFVPGRPFHPSEMFLVITEPTQSETPLECSTLGKALKNAALNRTRKLALSLKL